MANPAERIGSILGEIERTKGMVKSPDRRSAYLTPLYTQLAREIIAQYPEQVAAYRAGKLALLQFFIGQIMRRSKGKANPELAREILEKELE